MPGVRSSHAVHRGSVWALTDSALLHTASPSPEPEARTHAHDDGALPKPSLARGLSAAREQRRASRLHQRMIRWLVGASAWGEAAAGGPAVATG